MHLFVPAAFHSAFALYSGFCVLSPYLSCALRVRFVSVAVGGEGRGGGGGAQQRPARAGGADA
jgi:hypothetical protein